MCFRERLAGTALASMLAVAALGAGPFQGLPGSIPAWPTEPNPPPAEHREPTRLVAAALAVTLGPFGGHRLYLGTDAKVPVFYGITFGGFGVLVVIDLAHILFTKDLAPFEHNEKILMWSHGGPPEGAPSTPP
jgi:TM2 domain-containing membrane protein YozV